MVPDAVEVAIVGSGFAGLGMAIRLRQRGHTDFVVLERAGEVGGTWRDNTYPGAACDVPSHLYSFSFAPNPRWSKAFSDQPEILDYLRDCADRYGVRPHIRFGHDVREARWDAGSAHWLITTSAGPVKARYLVSGQGPLAEPAVPDLPGLADFQGELWHSARWNHDADLDGASVAVIGTGASAVQFVPVIRPRVGHLDLYQRTPPWIVPRNDRVFKAWERRMFSAFPPAQLGIRASVYWSRELMYLAFKSWARHRNPARRIALAHLRAQVPDPELRARLTPAYSIGCKRILLSDDYYPSLSQPNVTLISDGIDRITAGGVRARDGVERPADVIVLGTGFRATDPPAARMIFGADGVRLEEAWTGGMAAYKGTTVAGYPNLFLLVGPNTGLGHNSMIYMIESQVAYVADALDTARRRGATEVEVTAQAQQAWNERIAAEMAGTVWLTGGCSSWYLDPSGRNTTLWPGFSFRFRQALRRFDADAYELRRVPAPPEPALV